MQQKVIFATSNNGKMIEIKSILANFTKQLFSMAEVGIDLEIEESGDTFQDNAIIKARAVWNQCGGIVLADDSGLVIDYLNGEPGVYSSRYLGEDTSYEIKNQMIIDRLKGVHKEQRSARFVSVIAAILPSGKILCTEGIVEGLIAKQAHGTEGFGYDPIFYLPFYSKTAAELSLEEKNHISHRGQALRKMKNLLEVECKGEMK